MHSPAFSCLLEVDAENLKGVVRRMVGITQDASASLTSQLSAIRLIVGLERQIFRAAKEELLTRRAEASVGQGPIHVEARFDPVISVAIVKQLLTFLTGLIHNPEVSETHAVRAGNLILSLQKIALEESKWNRLHANPKPESPSPTSSSRSSRRTRPANTPSNSPALQPNNQAPDQLDQQLMTSAISHDLDDSFEATMSAESMAGLADGFGVGDQPFDTPTHSTHSLRKVLGELIGSPDVRSH